MKFEVGQIYVDVVSENKYFYRVVKINKKRMITFKVFKKHEEAEQDIDIREGYFIDLNENDSNLDKIKLYEKEKPEFIQERKRLFL